MKLGILLKFVKPNPKNPQSHLQTKASDSIIYLCVLVFNAGVGFFSCCVSLLLFFFLLESSRDFSLD